MHNKEEQYQKMAAIPNNIVDDNLQVLYECILILQNICEWLIQNS